MDLQYVPQIYVFNLTLPVTWKSCSSLWYIWPCINLMCYLSATSIFPPLDRLRGNYLTIYMTQKFRSPPNCLLDPVVIRVIFGHLSQAEWRCDVIICYCSATMHSSLWVYFWISWRHITSSSVAGQIGCIDALESRSLTPNGWKIIYFTSSIYYISRNEHAWEMTPLSWPTDPLILGNPLSNNNVMPLALNIYVSKTNSLPGQNSESIVCSSKCMWISWSSFAAVMAAINSILGILMFFGWAKGTLLARGETQFLPSDVMMHR